MNKALATARAVTLPTAPGTPEAGAALARIQLRNVEALVAAQRATLDGNRTLLEEIGEIARETAEKSLKAVQDIAAETDPKANVGKRFDLFKTALQDGIGNANRIAEVSARASAETATILQNRTFAALDETRAMLERLIDALPTTSIRPRG